ncbi:MAG TPA: hypothetical protein VGB74_09010 [Actinoplanes sp.]
MSATDAEAWLEQESKDLLEQGPFGLYELVWGLRGAAFGLTDDEARAIAARIVRRLVADGVARICTAAWPTLEVVQGPLPVAVLDDPATWSEGDSGPLFALVPADPGAG